MVAYCIWDDVWICVNLQLGPGRSCVQGCKRYLKKRIGFETPGRMALAGHFAMIPHLRTYYFRIYPGFLQALLIFPRLVCFTPPPSHPHPSIFFFFFSFLLSNATFFSSYHYFSPHAPNGHLTNYRRGGWGFASGQLQFFSAGRKRIFM